MAKITDDETVVCEQCGETFKQIGSHWGHPSVECDFPTLTQLQRDILLGALLGDGCIGGKRERNQRVQISWGSEEQCAWIDEALGWLSTGAFLKKTAEEVMEQTRGRDSALFTGSDDSKDWSDQYGVRTRSHPFITEMTTRWYGDSGYEKKEWPEDLVLSPTVLLIWFISDGCYNDKGENRYIRISLKNEMGNKEKVEQYFHQADIPEPSRWGGADSYSACWRTRESKSLFEYMSRSPLMDDGPPSGFEYKWPSDMGGTGKSMVDVEPISQFSEETPQTAAA